MFACSHIKCKICKSCSHALEVVTSFLKQRLKLKSEISQISHSSTTLYGHLLLCVACTDTTDLRVTLLTDIGYRKEGPLPKNNVYPHECPFIHAEKCTYHVFSKSGKMWSKISLHKKCLPCLATQYNHSWYLYTTCSSRSPFGVA